MNEAFAISSQISQLAGITDGRDLGIGCREKVDKEQAAEDPVYDESRLCGVTVTVVQCSWMEWFANDRSSCCASPERFTECHGLVVLSTIANKKYLRSHILIETGARVNRQRGKSEPLVLSSSQIVIRMDVEFCRRNVWASVCFHVFTSYRSFCGIGRVTTFKKKD